MRWYKVVQAGVGHGDTLSGQRLRQERDALFSEVKGLRASAADGGPNDVLPRWKGEVRRAILLLPPEDKIGKLSMMEIEGIALKVSGIRSMMDKYSAKRLGEIIGGS